MALLAQLDLSFGHLLIIPAGMVLAAWFLQMACSIAAVDPPDFWQSMLCMILVVVANVVMRVWLNDWVTIPGLGSQLLAPLILTVAIVAVMVRTGPVSALVITVCEGLLCTGIFIAFETLGVTLGQVY